MTLEKSWPIIRYYSTFSLWLRTDKVHFKTAATTQVQSTQPRRSYHLEAELLIFQSNAFVCTVHVLRGTLASCWNTKQKCSALSVSDRVPKTILRGLGCWPWRVAMTSWKESILHDRTAICVILDRRNDTARIYRSFCLVTGNVGYIMTTDQIGGCRAQNYILG